MTRTNRSMPVAAVAAALSSGAIAQAPPVNGMRPADVRADALINATVVTAPGQVLETGVVILRDGVIEAVGADAPIPPDARIHDLAGLHVYAGLIEPALLVTTEAPPRGPGAHWNSRIHPERSITGQGQPDAKLRAAMRELGFTTAAVYGDSGIFRGTGAVVALADEAEHVLAYQPRAAMAMGLDYGGGWASATYPGSLMGAFAAIRQTFRDAQWHQACRNVYRDHQQGNEPPVRADALTGLADVIGRRQPVMLDLRTELDVNRAARLADEFDLDMSLLGNGLEFRVLDDVIAANLPLIVPLSFPKRPEVGELAAAHRVSLRDMMTWEQAPTNPRRLVDAGLTVTLSTHGLKSRDEFPARLRKTIKHGLTEDAALAALTTTPAELLGLEAVLGTIEPGKAANLVVIDGRLFDEKRTIRSTWINGRHHEINPPPALVFDGTATLHTSLDTEHELELLTSEKKPKVTLIVGDDEKLKADDVTVQRDRLAFIIDGSPFGAPGRARFSGAVTGGVVTGTAHLADGRVIDFTISEPVEPVPEPEAVADADGVEDELDADEAANAPAALAAVADDADADADEAPESEDEPFVMPPDALPRPLGAYGLTESLAAEDVLVVNATIWTCGDEGIVENGALHVVDGRIAGVYDSPPQRLFDVRRIDAAGKHVTPGLIDCHSHTGISGSVNEWTQANTAEVRIGDVVDPESINWYRELAGGLTAANLLHGSANPIGGQNAVVKLKWGEPASAFLIEDAIGGIKFALGENVKRTRGRYPDTRMGVETFIRDAFTAAIDYQEAIDRYVQLPSEARQRTMPPRRDLELDALSEILRGERLVHCHSYRQDEILMLIRLADDFGFTIGTFQHVLEGYKVADAMAEHGAGGSSFSDWWAYKMEVMDAVPYNGALMHEVGVLVSFNSDSSELARRMNTEAAKAVRYGGMEPHEALKFVTINPARQLRIDHRTGSLEAGKDADFVIWSGDPLSTYSRCEQTWIEGVCRFSLEQDQVLRLRDRADRQRLVQRILTDAHGRTDKTGDDEQTSDDAADEAEQPVDDQLRQWMAEQVRLGHDPEEIRPACCADMHHWADMHGGGKH